MEQIQGTVGVIHLDLALQDGIEYSIGVSFGKDINNNQIPVGEEGAYTQIFIEQNTPTLYYYCANHTGMGGKAVVVGSAESITNDKLALNNIPGVNITGNQDTTGKAATATLAETVNVKANTTAGNRHYLTMVKSSLGAQDLHTQILD